MLIFNNLVINLHNPKLSPFLFNLLSFRRRLLNPDEMNMIYSMVQKKEKFELFNEKENELYNILLKEKQFLNNEVLTEADKRIAATYASNIKKMEQTRELNVSIQLTQECNMNCSYCYEKKYLKDRKSFNKQMIDDIQNFYEVAYKRYGLDYKICTIRMTGGESLLNQQTVDVINYVADKWPEAKLHLQTNGINLLKYHDSLPLDRFEKFFVSLDGKAETHLKRRFTKTIDTSVYDSILAGIKQLLKENRAVEIRAVLDNRNYKEYPEFIKYLREEGLLDYPKFECHFGMVCDMSNELGINPDFNNKYDIANMTSFMMDNNFMNNNCIYPILSVLSKLLSREHDTFVEAKTQKCDTRFCANNYFSPNGNVYFCDCIDDNKSIIGKFYPEISFNDELINRLESRNPIFTDKKCKICAYKYVCLGGCPLSALVHKNDVVMCGVFEDEEIMDKLSCVYPSQNIARKEIVECNES